MDEMDIKVFQKSKNHTFYRQEILWRAKSMNVYTLRFCIHMTLDLGHKKTRTHTNRHTEKETYRLLEPKCNK